MAIDVTTLSIVAKSEGIEATTIELRRLAEAANKVGVNLTKASAGVDLLNKSVTTGLAGISAYAASLTTISTNTSGLSKVSTTFTNTVKESSSALTEVAGTTKKVSDEKIKAAESTRKYTERMNDMHAAARGLAGSLGALWVTYGNALPLAAGLAIGASFRQVITLGAQFENVMTALASKSEATNEQVDQARKTILSLSSASFAPLEVAKAFETLVLAGLKVDDAARGVKSALNLAVVGGAGVEKSSEVLVQVSSALGLTSSSFDMIADKIAKTAAVSMASVDGLSESFKSGVVVGKLYKTSLVDISVGLAALANLGVQRSAAGTSLKNFYSEIFATTPKVIKAFKDIGIVATRDFKDANGAALDFVTIIGKIDAALKKLEVRGVSQQISQFTNERGVKVVNEALDMFNRLDGNGVNKLAALKKDLEDTAGFAAIGAARQALSAQKQLESVANTLKTTFTQAFEETSPMVTLFSQKMKEAFGSETFKKQITGLSIALGQLAVSVANNIGPITSFLGILVSLKVAGGIAATFTALSTTLVGVGTAFTALRAGALTFSAALGPLGLALGAISLAIGTYLSLKDRAISFDDKKQAAKSQVDSFIDSLEKDRKRIEEENKLLAAGVKAEDVSKVLASKNQFLNEIKPQEDLIADLEKRKSKLESDLAAITSKASGGAIKLSFNNDLFLRQKEIQKLNEKIKLEKENLDVFKNAIEGRINALKKEQSAKDSFLAKEEEQKKKEMAKLYGTGMATQNNSGEQARISDRYQANLKVLDGQIQAARDYLSSVRAQAEFDFKNGQIGRLQQIKVVNEALIKSSETELKLLRDKLQLEAKPENRLSLMQDIRNAEQRQSRELAENRKREIREIYEYANQLQNDSIQRESRAFEVRGQFVEAYKLRFQEANKKIIAQINSDLNIARSELESARASAMFDFSADAQARVAATDNLIKQLEGALSSFNNRASAELSEAAAKEADFKFQAILKKSEADLANLRRGGALKGSILEEILPNEEINRFRRENIENLKAALEELRLAAQTSGDPLDVKRFEEARGNYERLAADSGSAFQRAFTRYMQSDVNSVQNVFERTFKNLEDVIAEFIKTGKFSFKDFAKSVLSELISLQAKAVALQIGKSLFAGFGQGQQQGGSGGGGIFGSLLKTAASAAVSYFTGGIPASGGLAPTPGLDFAPAGSMNEFSSLRFGGAMAAGGATDPFTMYRVNEAGPEVFSMGGREYLMTGADPGRVIPNKSGNTSAQKITIVNQTTGRIDSVEEKAISENERVLIIREAVSQAETRISNQMNNPNSKFSRTFKNNFKAERVR